MNYMKYNRALVMLEEQNGDFCAKEGPVRGHLKVETGNGKGALRCTAQNLRYYPRGEYIYKLILFGKKGERTLHAVVGNLVVNRFGNSETYFRFNPMDVDGRGSCYSDYFTAIVASVSTRDSTEPLHPVLKGLLENEAGDRETEPQSSTDPLIKAASAKEAAPPKPEEQPAWEAAPPKPEEQPVWEAAPPKPEEQPVWEAAPPKPEEQPDREAAPPEPKEQPVWEAAPPEPKEQPDREAAPPEPKEQPVWEAAPPEPKEQPAWEAAPPEPEEQPDREAAPPEPEDQPAWEAAPPEPEERIDPAASLSQDLKDPHNYNRFYNEYLLNVCGYTCKVADYYEEVHPFESDRTQARWKKMINVASLPLVSPGAHHFATQYRHYLFGARPDKDGNAKRFYFGIPGRFLETEQPDGGRSGFTFWQPMRGADREKMAYGYWIVSVDAKTGNIEDV